MLVSTLRTDVRANLNDQGITFYTDVDILDSLQDACDQLVLRAGLIEEHVDIPFQANEGYYDLSVLIPDFYAVTQIYHNVTKRWLVPLTTTDYDGVRDDWELWTGTSEYFTPIDQKRIVVVPRPPTTNGTMKVYYKAKSPTLTPTLTLPFPVDISHVPEQYATADLLEQAREYSKASIVWNDANAGLGDAVKRTQARAMPALIYRLREMRYGN
jgi:hypothetical protein